MVVFDKTGTLTLGRPELLDANAIPDSVLQTAAGVAAASRHPFARAIVAAAETRLKIVATPEGVVETPGYVSSARRRRVPSGLAPRSGAG
jgi:Cu2+-exporting ATPase